MTYVVKKSCEPIKLDFSVANIGDTILPQTLEDLTSYVANAD